MVSLWMILIAIVVLGGSGVPGGLVASRPRAGQWIATVLMVCGSGIGLAGSVLAMGESAPTTWRVPWTLPWGAPVVGLDAISVLFLLPIFVVPVLGAIYGQGYWHAGEHAGTARWLNLFYGVLAAAMACVTIARDGVLFLVAWEVMALAAYFLLISQQTSARTRRVAWIYLIATHMGTLCLFAMFALWRQGAGSFELSAQPMFSPQLAGAVFVLALIGFGFKAGVFPLHFWLPGAHASAPSHVSAVLSGVMLKAGIYGIVRMTALLPQPPAWWGAAMLVVGAVSGVFGIACALAQRDVKRMLAYSSVENIGVIVMGLGLAVLGRSRGQSEWIVLGMGGAMLHLVNHSLFKPMLFFAAGAVHHATGTREMDRLGGLAKRMPVTMALFATGAVAICALPPLNGFVGEWLLYVGMLRPLTSEADAGAAAVAVAAVVLALVGALALACFVKALGTIFLGSPRTAAAEAAHEPSATMIAPMAALATGCIIIGLIPRLAAPMLQGVTYTWGGLTGKATVAIQDIAPLGWITTMGLALVAAIVALVVIGRWLMRGHVVRCAGTWDCGHAQPTARMQYTGASLTHTLTGLLAWVVWPRTWRPALRGLFARPASHRSTAPDPVLDRGLSVGAAAAMRLLPWVRRLQQGSIHAYLLYVLLIVVFLFLVGM